MGVFHVFKFVQMVPNRATHHVYHHLDNRPGDYPENFGICSQLNRKSKTWFFTFLDVYIF